MYQFEEIAVGENGLNDYSIEHLDIILLMFQSGYLTIKSKSTYTDTYILTYPNKEVKKSYLDYLLTAYNQANKGLNAPLIDKIIRVLEIGKVEDLQSILNTLFKSFPHELWQKENEHFYHALMHISFSLLGVFIQSEIQTSDGRMDALVQNKDYIFCFEFKLDESADIAIQQIKEKGHLEPFAHDARKKLAVGINFSKELKKVSELKWEEVG